MDKTPTLTIACVKWGDKYGPEYVNILYERIKRHLSVPFSFICATDDPFGIDDGVECVPLPDGMDGWWNKLWLFSPEFQEICHERVMFFDLDTIVVDHFDELASYDGTFIILRDFYRPDGYGSGLMAWKRGYGEASIWDRWNREGRPILDGGDQAFIERCILSADLWQDRYPERVVSYKVDASKAIPGGAQIVCFHGHPRPHECKGGWVEATWRVGGALKPKFENHTKVPAEGQFANIKANISRAPLLKPTAPHNGKCVIVGGAPSLRMKVEEIRKRKRRGEKIFATNGTANFLMQRGIIPDCHVIMDAQPECAAFVEKPRRGVKYLINAMVDPSVFDALEGYDVHRWHSTSHDDEKHVQIIEAATDERTLIISAGNTVGLTSITLGFYMGFRDFHLYGMDSCVSKDKHHAYKQKWDDGQDYHEVIAAGGKTYTASFWMMHQAQYFQEIWKALVPEGASITAHGPGLLPDVCRHMNSVMKRKTMELINAV